MHRGAAGRALLAGGWRYFRRRLLERGRALLRYAGQTSTALAEIEDALHLEAVGALLVGGDRGVGEGAAGDDRGPAFEQGRRALAELALGGALAVPAAQLGGALGGGEVDPHGQLRGGEPGFEAGARLRRRHDHGRVLLPAEAEPVDDPLDD